MSDCKHWWIVEPPSGEPEMAAVCKLCGAQRTFPASLEEEWQKPSVSKGPKILVVQ